MSELDLSLKESQRYIDRARVYVNGEVMMEKNRKIKGVFEVVVYEPEPRGLKPIFENDAFALFDKPSGVLVHPTGRHTTYSLLDEVLHLYGKDAKVVHRLDRETSGLILVAKNKKSEVELKMMFERREVEKSYIALAEGKVERNFEVNAPLFLPQNSFKQKIIVDERGKPSLTRFEIEEYFDDIDATLLRVFPLTGRQHQIRVHLFHVKHKILGDPLYGVCDEIIEQYLDEVLPLELRIEMMGASRLLLHADTLSFTHEGVKYDFKSSVEVKKEFYNKARKSV